MKRNKYSYQHGFLVIEALIAVVIFSLVGLSMFFTISYLQLATQKKGYDADAALLAQEATEIAHSALLSDWGGYSDGRYFPVYDADQEGWILISGEETNVQTRYTRHVTLAKVCRDMSTGMQIQETCTGVIDGNSRYIHTVVSWSEGDESKSIETSLLTFKVPEQ